MNARLRGTLCGCLMLMPWLWSFGCSPAQNSGGRPSAPDRFRLAAKPPVLRDYPEFAETGQARIAEARGRVPLLPVLRRPVCGDAAMGLRPVMATVAGNGKTRTVAMNPSGFDNNGRQPMEQLIYGGAYPAHDISGNYRFNVRDRLRINVARHPEFSGEVVVLQDGSVKIPNTDDYIVVKGLDSDQVARGVVTKIAPYIKGVPKVKVNITFGRGEFYYVFGEVKNSGRFPMGISPVRLSEAIFRANSRRLGRLTDAESSEERLRDEMELSPREGFSVPTYANLMQVSVITPHRSHPTRRVYNVKRALLQGVTGNDPVVRPGQIIWVPSTFDKRLIAFFKRYIAPIQAVGTADAETAHWYGRITGNTVKGVEPSVYRVKGSGLTK